MYKVCVREYQDMFIPDKKYILGFFDTLEEASAAVVKFKLDKEPFANYYTLTIKESYTKTIVKTCWRTVK